jgi:hypothetical protein
LYISPNPELINYLNEVVTQKRLSVETMNNINNILYPQKYVGTLSELLKIFQNTKLSERHEIISDVNRRTISTFRLFSDPIIGKDIESIVRNHMKLISKNINIPLDHFDAFFDIFCNKAYSNKESNN